MIIATVEPWVEAPLRRFVEDAALPGRACRSGYMIQEQIDEGRCSRGGPAHPQP